MSKKLTNEEFIAKSLSIHGDKYDYSLVDYKNSHSKVYIKCNLHGLFYMKPNNHLNNQGCPKCGKLNITSNTENFIKKSKKIHGNKYNYSLVKYTNSKNKIDIICNIHGKFKQSPNNHLNNQGCPKCVSNYKVSEQEFIDRSNFIHNNFYSYENCGYTKIDKKISINCPIHGRFSQRPNNHLNGNKCPKCSRKNTRKDFIKKAIEQHGYIYDYSLVNYTSMKDKVTIVCYEHGKFDQIARNHVNNGYGCPKCGNRSKGEEQVKKLLEKLSIKFKTQKTFNKCKQKNPLHFDFYLPDFNTCVEYDGIQHFKPIEFFGGEEKFKNRIKRDKIKNDFCNKNNIKLIRIKYTDYNNIEEILKKEIYVGNTNVR